MTAIPVAEMTFEQAMADLEQVVTQLERGDVALEDSIALYERGAELKNHCEAGLSVFHTWLDVSRTKSAPEQLQMPYETHQGARKKHHRPRFGLQK